VVTAGGFTAGTGPCGRPLGRDRPPRVGRRLFRQAGAAEANCFAVPGALNDPPALDPDPRMEAGMNSSRKARGLAGAGLKPQFTKKK